MYRWTSPLSSKFGVSSLARVHCLKVGDTDPSRMFFKAVKVKKDQDYIRTIKDATGVIQHKHASIESVFSKHLANIVGHVEEVPWYEQKVYSFWEGMQSEITDFQRQHLARPFTEVELEYTVKRNMKKERH